MALNVSVFKNPLGDCTHGGISSRTTELCLINVDGPSLPRGDTIPAFLVRGNAAGHVKIVPAEFDGAGQMIPSTRWCMMGGNYAATSDGRFHEAVRKITGGASYGAVPIHDRIES